MRYFRVVFRRWFYFLLQAQRFGDLHRHFSWPAQHFRRLVSRVFANRIVRTASSGDNVRGILGHLMKIGGGVALYIDFEIVEFGVHEKLAGKRRFWSCLKIWGSLIRNARFGLPTCLVLILWCSCGVAVPSGEAAKPFIFEGFKSGCTAVLHGRHGISWHFHVCKKVSKIVLCDMRNTLARLSENDCHFSWQGQHFGQVHFHFTWRARHFRTLHFTLQLYTPHSTLYTPHLTLYTSHFTLHTLHLALYTLHFTLNTPHSTLYTPHFALYTWHSTLNTSHLTLYTLHFTLYIWHSTLYTRHSTLDTPDSALHSTLYNWHSALYTLLFTLHTLYFTLPTLHPTFYTLHSTLYTSHFPLHTLHFTLYTLHFTLDTSHSTLPTSYLTHYIPHSTFHCLAAHTLHSTPFDAPQSTLVR